MALTKHRAPWFKLYTKDIRTDPFCADLTPEQFGIYMRLLMIDWDEDGIDPEWLQKPGRIRREFNCHERTFNAAWNVLQAKFERVCNSSGHVKLRSARLERERSRAAATSEAARKAAQVLHSRSADALREKRNRTEREEETESEREEGKAHTQPDKPAAPLPFRAATALAYLAEGGRFVAVKPKMGHVITIEKIIRDWPDPSAWRAAGAWLAAGGDAWRGDVDTRCVGEFAAWLEHAKIWESQGRPPIGKNGKQMPLAGPAKSLSGHAAPQGHATETRNATGEFFK